MHNNIRKKIVKAREEWIDPNVNDPERHDSEQQQAGF